MIETDINKRWEDGTPHHPKSLELFKALEEIDLKHGGDYFQWKSGGDGDNGEHMMHEMDIHFEQLDEQNKMPDAGVGPPAEPGHYWLRQDHRSRSTQVVVKRSPSLVRVILDYKPRSRKRGPEAEKILIVSGGYWTQPLSEFDQSLCVWGRKIECDISQ